MIVFKFVVMHLTCYGALLNRSSDYYRHPLSVIVSDVRGLLEETILDPDGHK